MLNNSNVNKNKTKNKSRVMEKSYIIKSQKEADTHLRSRGV